ncbi:hypothetical protein EPUL_001971, partial [Erysiphe pulchra]
MGELENIGGFTKVVIVWSSLVANIEYVPGLLTLDYSLKKFKSKYPLVALYTDQLPLEARSAIATRGIPMQRINFLAPKTGLEHSVEERFYFCWSKLMAFGLTEYERLVLLDSDMLVLQNMDELMEMELDTPQLAGTGNRVFAAGYACICNPLKKTHYPKDWSREQCPFFAQHTTPLVAQTAGPSTDAKLPNILNTGLLVINPCISIFNHIIDFLRSDLKLRVNFAEQALLSELFHGRWVPLPYTYNALKTLRWNGVHSEIWRDDCVKNIHYILTPKPWEEIDSEGRNFSSEPTHQWWANLNLERLDMEKKRDIPCDFFQ